MPYKRLFSGCTAIAFLTVSAWAGTIHDPAAGVIDDNFSSPISTFSGTFDPRDNGGAIGFYNDTGAIITALFLHTTIRTGLSTTDINNSFTCNSPSPFFLFCGFDYIGSTGSLTIGFYGVNPADGDELGGFDPELNEQEGIPPIVGACLATPNDPGCTKVGHFAFVFNNDFLTGGTDLVNGWNPRTTSSANPGTLLFSTQPMFDAPQFTVTPEPGSLLLLGGGVLALGGFLRRRAR